MRKPGALLAIAALGLSACAGSGSAPASEPTAADPPSVEVPVEEPTPTEAIDPGADRVLDPDIRHLLPAGTDQLRGEGATLALVGVHRIEPTVLAVVGVLTPTDAFDPLILTEPAYAKPGAGDFSNLTLTVPDDPRAYLPMRTDRGDCLCSPLNRISSSDPTAVHALFAVPADAETVTLTVGEFGTVNTLPITDIPTGERRSGLGPDLNIEVFDTTRTDGRMQVRIRLENPTGQTTRLPRGRYDSALIGSSGPCFRGLTVLGANGRTVGVASDVGCQRGYLPGSRKYVDLTLTMGDPGGRNLVFLPSLGVPLRGVPSKGEIRKGTREVVDGRVRFSVDQIEVVEVDDSDRLRVPLRAVVSVPDEVGRSDTEIDGDSTDDGDAATTTSSPTPTATGAEATEGVPPAALAEGGAQTLDQVVELVQDAPVKQLSLTVHAGGPGSTSEWLAWSRAQANLLVAELTDRLGADWTVNGTGAGPAEPLIPPSPGEQDRAQLRVNDRVEIRVGTPTG